MDNKISLENIRDKILGLSSCYIRVSYGGLLRLGLGEKRFYKNSEMNGMYHGEWDIISRECTWRIRRNNVVLCGQGDEIEYSSEKALSLSLGTVVGVEQREIFDLTIIFDSGIIIDYFMNMAYEPQLQIICNPVSAYELTEEGFIEIDPLELFKKSSEIDCTLKVYSDDCCKRWDKLVVKADTNKRCDDCFYFRSIDGYFHFWKFGLCSNHESEFDGKLVGIESGCEKFKQLKDLI